MTIEHVPAHISSHRKSKAMLKSWAPTLHCITGKHMGTNITFKKVNTETSCGEADSALFFFFTFNYFIYLQSSGCHPLILPPTSPHPTLPQACLWENAPLPPALPLLWSLKSLKDYSHLLPLRPDQANPCYIFAKGHKQASVYYWLVAQSLEAPWGLGKLLLLVFLWGLSPFQLLRSFPYSTIGVLTWVQWLGVSQSLLEPLRRAMLGSLL